MGKVVYLPLVAYLGIQALNAETNHLPFVGGVLLGYVLVLDLLPQSVIQPYVSGRQFDTITLLFAYVLGPMFFGWYGFFLLPIIFIVVFEAIRIVLPGLLHGVSLGQRPVLAKETGSRPLERKIAEESGDEDGESDSSGAGHRKSPDADSGTEGEETDTEDSDTPT
ncbi:hypothetical protein ACFQJC_06700 [Haloferax namakaokahaiae]|uniref:AI-2E family transporter n=1 Tax=Haloferax namakaokahaiae TaxID=1748331 RepID=A0ABD5ZD42_9EURY